MSGAVVISPARYAMTGRAYDFFCSLRPEFDTEDVQALDAPQWLPAGSVWATGTLCEGKPWLMACRMNFARVA